MIPALNGWENFYVVVGSSAGALIGLQFVVITLIAERTRASMQQVAAFGSPTVVHFCAALLIAAVISAPWTSLAGVAWSLAAVGLAGIVYGIIVLRRAQRQRGYQPVLSDWIWHTGLPLIGYGATLLAALLLSRDTMGSLFVIGAATLLLLFIGIHNSWDTVTYVALTYSPPTAPENPPRRNEE